jgi:uncharacterized protein (TIGR03382 family)
MTPLLLLPASLAATRHVDASGAGTYATIQSAIAASSSGDRIEVAAGTYSECLDLGGLSLTIIGAGSVSSAISCGGSSAAAITVTSGEELTLQGFTILNGHETGVLATNATLWLSDLRLLNLGDSSTDGAAILASGGQLHLSQSTVQDSTAARGAIFLSGGASLSVESSTFTDNVANQGPAIYALYDSASPGNTIELSSSSFSGNRADDDGGVIYAESYTWITSTGNSYTDNSGTTTSTDGGVFYLGSYGDLYSEGDVFEGSDEADSLPAQHGGVAYLDDHTGATFLNGTFLSLVASYGGAIYGQSFISLEIRGSEFVSNSASGSGGAISLHGYANVEMEDSSFLNNEAVSGYAGDLLMLDGGSLDLESTSIEGSSAGYGGGSMALFWVRPADLTDVSFVRTQADAAGGGAILAANHTELTITDATFTDTSAGDGGAIVFDSINSLTITRSTFEGAQATDGSGGAIYYFSSPIWSDYSGGNLNIVDSIFANNQSYFGGGAIVASHPWSLTLEGSLLTGNRSSRGSGGALLLYAHQHALLVANNRFCNNSSATSGGAVYSSTYISPATERWRNNIFQENSASEQGGALHLLPSADSQLLNNTLVGNGAVEGGGIYLSTYLDTTTAFVNNIFAATLSGDGITHEDRSAAGSFLYNNWFSNATSDYSGALSFSTSADGNHTADPGFRSYSLDGNCDNDDLRLATGSANIDAGHPDYPDLDGSPGDIGAFGGPGSLVYDMDRDGFDLLDDCDDLNSTAYPGATESCNGVDDNCDGSIDEAGASGESSWYGDSDGDGHGSAAAATLACEAPPGAVATDDDCDDAAPSTYPGAPDTWYDGIDADCSGGSDYDADGDGHEAADFGGADCDDEDAQISPDATEVEDGRDNNCDGRVDGGGEDTADPDTADPDTADPDTADPDTADPDTAEQDSAAPDTSDGGAEGGAAGAEPSTGGKADRSCSTAGGGGATAALFGLLASVRRRRRPPMSADSPTDSSRPGPPVQSDAQSPATSSPVSP